MGRRSNPTLRVINLSGDTDKNGCIAGGLLGAKFGYSKMMKENKTSKNIKIVLTCDPNKGDIKKEKKYIPNNILELSEKYYNLFIQ